MAAFPGTPHRKRHLVAFSFLSVLSFALVRSASAQSTPPECSLSKTNESCSLTIDRSNPVAPATIQMYSDQQLTVTIKNPLPFERYFLDFTTGQAALTPDVTSTIVQQIVPNLGKFQSHFAALAAKAAPVPNKGCDDALFAQAAGSPAKDGVAAAVPVFNNCFTVLSSMAIQTYRELEPLVAPDSLTQQQPVPETYYYRHNRCAILAGIARYITAEAAISNKISGMSKDTTTGYSPADQDLITELGEFQKLTDAISADLAGYSLRIRDLGPKGFGVSHAATQDTSDAACSWDSGGTYIVGSQVVYKDKHYLSKTGVPGASPDSDTGNWLNIPITDAVFRGLYDKTAAYNPGNQIADQKGHLWTCISVCTGYEPPTGSWMPSPASEWQSKNDVSITSRPDDRHIYKNMVTRTITYSLDTLNLVSYSQEAAATSTNKKALATVAINFADEPTRKFLGYPPTALRWEASAGVFFSWLPNRTFTLSPPPSTSTGTGSSTQTVQDSTTQPTPVPFVAANYRLTGDFGGPWKQNFYLTGAVGVNPNNTTAEFGLGPSYAWRGFMLSALCHIGHDTRPSSMTPGSNGDLPTASHWTEKFAMGISVRVPSLTGR